jgi:hypothetical protein
VFPVVTGMVDNAALDALVQLFLNAFTHGQHTRAGTAPGSGDGGTPAAGPATQPGATQAGASQPGPDQRPTDQMPPGLRSPEPPPAPPAASCTATPHQVKPPKG